MTELHVFHNDCDWVVATDAADARKAWAESCGEKREDYPDDEWEQWADDRPLVILDDDLVHKTTRTCAEWVKEHGRGFLCSTEY